MNEDVVIVVGVSVIALLLHAGFGWYIYRRINRGVQKPPREAD